MNVKVFLCVLSILLPQGLFASDKDKELATNEEFLLAYRLAEDEFFAEHTFSVTLKLTRDDQQQNISQGKPKDRNETNALPENHILQTIDLTRESSLAAIATEAISVDHPPPYNPQLSPGEGIAKNYVDMGENYYGIATPVRSELKIYTKPVAIVHADGKVEMAPHPADVVYHTLEIGDENAIYPAHHIYWALGRGYAKLISKVQTTIELPNGFILIRGPGRRNLADNRRGEWELRIDVDNGYIAREGYFAFGNKVVKAFKNSGIQGADDANVTMGKNGTLEYILTSENSLEYEIDTQSLSNTFDQAIYNFALKQLDPKHREPTRTEHDTRGGQDLMTRWREGKRLNTHDGRRHSTNEASPQTDEACRTEAKRDSES